MLMAWIASAQYRQQRPAYQECDLWLADLKHYLQDNIQVSLMGS